MQRTIELAPRSSNQQDQMGTRIAPRIALWLAFAVILGTTRALESPRRLRRVTAAPPTRVQSKRQAGPEQSRRNEDPWFLEQAPQPYSFAYDVKGAGGRTEQYRREVGDGRFLTGSYGYVLPDGIYRHVDYVADDNGFRAFIRTSEPGTANQNPADVSITATNPIGGGSALSSAVSTASDASAIRREIELARLRAAELRTETPAASLAANQSWAQSRPALQLNQISWQRQQWGGSDASTTGQLTPSARRPNQYYSPTSRRTESSAYKLLYDRPLSVQGSISERNKIAYDNKHAIQAAAVREPPRPSSATTSRLDASALLVATEVEVRNPPVATKGGGQAARLRAPYTQFAAAQPETPAPTTSSPAPASPTTPATSTSRREEHTGSASPATSLAPPPPGGATKSATEDADRPPRLRASRRATLSRRQQPEDAELEALGWPKLIEVSSGGD